MIRRFTSHKSPIIGLLLIGGAGVACVGHAQQFDTPFLLDPIVITATQGEHSQRDAPASITVIDGQELRQRPNE